MAPSLDNSDLRPSLEVGLIGPQALAVFDYYHFQRGDRGTIIFGCSWVSTGLATHPEAYTQGRAGIQQKTLCQQTQSPLCARVSSVALVGSLGDKRFA